MRFNKTYGAITLFLFIIETLIAIYIKTGFTRHTFGDFLCVIILYCFFKIFIANHHFKVAISVLIIAFTIEFLQLTDYLKLFNLQNNNLAKIILGSTFEISDLVAYMLGILTAIAIEVKIYKLWIT